MSGGPQNETFLFLFLRALFSKREKVKYYISIFFKIGTEVVFHEVTGKPFINHGTKTKAAAEFRTVQH